MFKCHICQLETKQLNGLMSRHYRSHCSENYLKEHYKRDVLIANNRAPKYCKICNLETIIPKGERDYPDYHRLCYLKHMVGRPENNPNFKNKLIAFTCDQCGQNSERQESQLNGKKRFCSYLCSATYWSYPDNISEAKRLHWDNLPAKMREVMKDPEIRARVAAGKAEAFKDRCSQLERDVFAEVKKLYPNAQHSVALDFYTVDIFLEETKQILEVQGDYWHSLPKTIILDKRKRTFYINKGYTVHYIYEHEWDSTPEKAALIQQTLSTPHVTSEAPTMFLIAGTSGSGKTWIINQLKEPYACIEKDSIKNIYEELALRDSSKPILMGLHNGISTFIKRAGTRFDVRLICIQEDATTLEQRIVSRGGQMTPHILRRIQRIGTLSKRPDCIFTGTSSEVLAFLQTL